MGSWVVKNDKETREISKFKILIEVFDGCSGREKI